MDEVRVRVRRAWDGRGHTPLLEQPCPRACEIPGLPLDCSISTAIHLYLILTPILARLFTDVLSEDYRVRVKSCHHSCDLEAHDLEMTWVNMLMQIPKVEVRVRSR